MSILDRFKNVLKGGTNLGLLDVSGRFSLDRHAFTGTMSKFHVATEITSRKVYGIKLLDTEKTALFKARFKGLNKPTEGEIGTEISHPRIVKTYEYGKTTTGQEFILMEYVHGPGINTLIKNRDKNVIPHRLNLIRQMAEALNAVHEQGFIHRDVCPRNFIAFEDLSWLKLIDFGLTVPDDTPYHQPGNRTGTPQYMAPEIVRRRETSHAVDIFSFGITAYRFLTWEHPWGSTDTTGKAALVHDSRDPDPITKHRPNLHPKLVRAVHRCLERKPTARLQSLKAFLAMIRDVKEEDQSTST